MILIKKLTLLSALFLYTPPCESKTFNSTGQNVRKFPDGFLFGAATAAYQVEGGWNADGKGESIWDRLTHTNSCIIDDCLGGDIACNSYYNYKRDVQMVRELGLDFYRFSISWARILPDGFSNKINQAGVQYYNNLINELLKYKITPFVTMYHWDLPQTLQDLGGWANPLIVDWYSDYVTVLYKTFGDRVKHWLTMNEPSSICFSGYGDVQMAPIVNSQGIGVYLCSKHLLLAHANAYHIYHDRFSKYQGNGKVGITIESSWYLPETSYDSEAAETAYEFLFGQYAHPIFSETGDWPPIMKKKVAAKSAAQGFPRSRLPEFTPEEVKLIRGSADFLGLNHYTTSIAKPNLNKEAVSKKPSLSDDHGVLLYQPKEWEPTASSWFKVYSPGFFKLLTSIKENYNNPIVYVTENGMSTRGGLEDDNRVAYYRKYLDALLDAIENGSNIKAYFAWSLMDNFEWLRGYTERFGLYQVDYQSPYRTRTPRKSAFVYKEIVRTRTLDHNYKPNTNVMTIDIGH